MVLYMPLSDSLSRTDNWRWADVTRRAVNNGTINVCGVVGFIEQVVDVSLYGEVPLPDSG